MPKIYEQIITAKMVINEMLQYTGDKKLSDKEYTALITAYNCIEKLLAIKKALD